MWVGCKDTQIYRTNKENKTFSFPNIQKKPTFHKKEHHIELIPQNSRIFVPTTNYNT
jgi:hypothetical protein